MSRAQSKAQYKGFDHHIHVTVTASQNSKLKRLAKRRHLSISAVVREIIDGVEVAK